MKRFAPFLILLALAACDDDPTTPPTPHVWTCADLQPTAAFSWRVDPVLDTLVTYTVRITYPETLCRTESMWVRWNDAGGIAFAEDHATWFRLPSGKLEASSTLTRDDWAAHGDSIYVVWGLYPDFDADSLCTDHSPFDCPEYDTLAVRALLP